MNRLKPFFASQEITNNTAKNDKSDAISLITKC